MVRRIKLRGYGSTWWYPNGALVQLLENAARPLRVRRGDGSQWREWEAAWDKDREEP